MLVPRPIQGLPRITAIQEDMALAADGAVWTWGANSLGELGQGTSDDLAHPLPRRVPGLSDVVAIAAGAGERLVVRRDGTVWGWGVVLGWSSTRPIPIKGLRGIVAIAADTGGVSLALKTNGTIWSWSRDYVATDGRGGSVVRHDSIPHPFTGLAHVVAIATPPYSTVPSGLAVEQDGTAWAWGSNYYSQLGQGTFDPRPHPLPQRVPGLSHVVSAAASDSFNVAVTRNGSVWAWGNNDLGQLNGHLTVNQRRPQLVRLPLAMVAVAVGKSFTVALAHDGSVWTWGTYQGPSTPYGSWLPPSKVTGLSSVVAIAGQVDSVWPVAVALTRDGKVWAWGQATFGELGVH